MDSLLIFLLPLLLIGVLFFSGRKQRKQAAEMQEMQRQLEEGDVVVTTSGLRGIVVDAGFEDTIDLEIADDVVTTWVRAAVREKVAVDEPAATDGAATDGAATDGAATDGAATDGAGAVDAGAVDAGAVAEGPSLGKDVPSLTKDDTPRG